MKITIPEQTLEVEAEEIGFQLAMCSQETLAEVLHSLAFHLADRGRISGHDIEYYLVGIGDHLVDRKWTDEGLETFKLMFKVEEKND